MSITESFALFGYEKFHGVSYTWGGKFPDLGLDCSGFVSQCLKAFGLLDEDETLNSQGLHDHFVEYGIGSTIELDSLLFFGESINKITHVAIALNDWQMIESSGEGRVSSDRGFVRVRPIANRDDLVAVISFS